MFIALEGIDGAGKSTQIACLADAFRARGRTVTTLRDPGSTSLGEILRGVVVDGRNGSAAIGLRAEMLIFMAARAQLVEERIEPALAAGEVVICDRFLLSNVCYQGYGGGLDPAEILTTGRIACRGRLPDLSLVIDLPVEIALARVNRPLDRMEQKGRDYLARVRQGFLTEAARGELPIAVADGTLPPADLAAQLAARVFGSAKA